MQSSFLYIQDSVKNQFKTINVTDSRNLSLSALFTFHSFSFSPLEFLKCQSCPLLIMLFIPSLIERTQSDMIRLGPLGSSHFQISAFMDLSKPAFFFCLFVYFFKRCVTVMVCPNNTSNKQQIHKCKLSVFFPFLCFLFLLSQISSMSQ